MWGDFMDKIDVSFIIPVYNTESYITKCVNSILEQNFDNIEIILVNDGSTDDSGKVCKRLSERYDCVKYLEHANCGPGRTRNKGISIASGEYLIFIDSDDVILPNKINELWKSIISADKPDIIEYGYQVVKGSSETNRSIKTGYSCDGITYYRQVLNKEYTYEWYAWKYAFRKEFWLEQRFAFPDGKYEDVSLIPFVIAKAKSVIATDLIIYRYNVERTNAITTGVSLNTEVDKLNVIERNIHNIELIQDMPMDVKLKLQNNMSYLYYSSLILSFSLNGADRRELISVLNQKRWVVDYTDRASKGQYLTANLIKIFGIKPVGFLLNIRRVLKDKIGRGHNYA